MVVYVDDILICTNENQWYDTTMAAFRANVLEIVETPNLSTYLGININTVNEQNGKFYFKLDQIDYINNINGDVGNIGYNYKVQETPMISNYEASKAMAVNDDNKYNIQSIVGSLRFAAELWRDPSPYIYVHTV